jgi:hypothetical protein
MEVLHELEQMTTTTKLWTVMLLGILSVPLAGQITNHTAARMDLACVDNLSIPVYWGLAWTVRARGTVRALISIGSNGTQTKIEIQSPFLILKGLVEKSLKESYFHGCAGQTVEINFIYQLRGNPNSDPKNEVRFKGPNTFVVIAYPPIPKAPDPAVTSQRH